MIENLEQKATGFGVTQVDSFTKPAWLRRLLADSVPSAKPKLRQGLSIQTAEVEGFSHLRLVVPGALALESRCFQRRVAEAYTAILSELGKRSSCFPLRFWNFVPGIHRQAHDGMVRYEAFNAGRFAAFADWYRTPRFGPRMVAASAIDPRSPDFIVEVLAASQPGRGLENPRQCSAYRYSRRYGPLPPCFARATLVETPIGGLDRRTLIVAGTASVVGEDSRHRGNLPRQVAETCSNMASLIEVAGAGSRRGHSPLSRFRELRVYLANDAHRGHVVDLLAARFPNLELVELMTADLCRPELLVEIESLVSLEPASGSAV